MVNSINGDKKAVSFHNKKPNDTFW